MRNSNGGGTVYKVAGKRRKPWVAVVTTGYSLEGKQLRKTLGTFKTKREGQEALFNYADNPNYFVKITFEEVQNSWFKTYLKRELAEGTIESYKGIMKKFKPISNLKIKDIKLHHLQEMFDNLKTSSNYKNNVKALLNSIMEYAIKNDYITTNKVKYIEIGKHEKVIERKIFTKKEIDTLWEHVNFNITSVILILIYTGMRIGELLNLKNEDINLENATLQINKSKTSSGIRIIPINSKLIKLFKQNLDTSQTYFLENKKKTKLNYQNFKRYFDETLSMLKIQPHTIHDTRHTFASLLNDAEANQTSILKLVGHSNFTTTQKVYTHKSTEELRKSIELLS